MTPDPVREAEAVVAAAADRITRPAPAECLWCFVLRLTAELGCDGTLRWTARWREVRLPGAVALERRLAARGGRCDCEVPLSGWVPLPAPLTSGSVPRVPGQRPAPRCERATGSAQPCLGWTPR